MLCFAWMSLRPKSYQFARAFVTLLCEDTLFSKFKDAKKAGNLFFRMEVSCTRYAIHFRGEMVYRRGPSWMWHWN